MYLKNLHKLGFTKILTFIIFCKEILTKGMFIKMAGLLTKNNHYYPQFLIRNWTDKDGNVVENIIKSNSKLFVKPKENLFEKRVSISTDRG